MWLYDSVRVMLLLCDDLQLVSLSDWRVTDFVASGTMIPSFTDDGHLYVTSEQARGHSLNRALYWQAPELYLGDKVRLTALRRYFASFPVQCPLS